MAKKLDQEILDFLRENPAASSSQIHKQLATTSGYATVKRVLAKLKDTNLIIQEGKGKNTSYSLAPGYEIIAFTDMDLYFKQEIDERKIKQTYNPSLLVSILPEMDLFISAEEKKLLELQTEFSNNISQLSATEYKKEMERLAIDLSWKSSQIEGNTYSLLETERLLTEKKTAEGKPQSDAIMLLNHKAAINFINENRDYLNPISIRAIEDIHSILVKDLEVERNIRQRRVGVSGTNYRPLDNEYQIREALEDMSMLVNNKKNIFEKALLALVLLSYIQPFVDGNKRTARIISNAVLLAHDHCPLSFRTVDPLLYKKAMLVFYEQNNISPIKQIFLEQVEFAVKTYF